MLTQEQASDLRQYVPDSEMVKLVYSELHKDEEDFDNWNETVVNLVGKVVGEDGDIVSLFNLLELTYMNAHNEGALETTAYEESIDGQG